MCVTVKGGVPEHLWSPLRGTGTRRLCVVPSPCFTKKQTNKNLIQQFFGRNSIRENNTAPTPSPIMWCASVLLLFLPFFLFLLCMCVYTHVHIRGQLRVSFRRKLLIETGSLTVLEDPQDRTTWFPSIAFLCDQANQ